MTPVRRLLRRAAMLTMAMLLLVPALLVQAAGQPAAVTGQLTMTAKIALSTNAVAVVVLVDQTASADGGSIIGLQRINRPGNVPIPFSLPYDASTIQPTHAYALFASLQDGAKVWQNLTAVPVITGGPTSNVQLPLQVVAAPPPAAVSGTIVRKDKSALSPSAVAIAALIKVGTGTVVSSQVLTAPGTSLAFAVGYDPATVDPAATYVVRAAIIDAPTAWSGGAGAPVITNGAPSSGVEIPVAIAPTAIPTPQPTATLKPTATPKPTPKPSVTPTPRPTTTPKPTTKPTPKPTASPTPSPTASPTPTPSPTEAPTASPSPTAETSVKPSATPATGVVTGTLTYAEQAKLSTSARAVVLLVAGTAKGSSTTIVASQVIASPGQKPIPFSVGYATKDIDPSLIYTIQADIDDGVHVWDTSTGVKVLTNGNPSSDVTVKLTYRADLLKGEVTGQITGVGISLAPGAYSAAVLIRVDTGQSIGVDVNPAPGKVTVPFSVAFDPATIDPNVDYVIRAEIVSGDQRWDDTNGVPVITKGNQISGVSVVVTSTAPSPSPSPVGGSSSGGAGNSNWLPILLVILLIGLAAAAYLYYRSKQAAASRGPDPAKSQAHPMGPADRAASATAVAAPVPPLSEEAPVEPAAPVEPGESAGPAAGGDPPDRDGDPA